MESNYLRDELYRGSSTIITGTKTVRIWSKRKYVGVKKTLAVESFLSELGFTEIQCSGFRQVLKPKPGGPFWVPDYDSWEINFEKMTFQKVRWVQPLTKIVAPLAIKDYIEKNPGLFSGYQYGI